MILFHTAILLMRLVCMYHNERLCQSQSLAWSMAASASSWRIQQQEHPQIIRLCSHFLALSSYFYLKIQQADWRTSSNEITPMVTLYHELYPYHFPSKHLLHCNQSIRQCIFLPCMHSRDIPHPQRHFVVGRMRACGNGHHQNSDIPADFLVLGEWKFEWLKKSGQNNLYTFSGPRIRRVQSWYSWQY